MTALSRDAEILTLRASGWTYGQIALHLGISRGAVAGVCDRQPKRPVAVERENRPRGFGDGRPHRYPVSATWPSPNAYMREIAFARLVALEETNKIVRATAQKFAEHLRSLPVPSGEKELEPNEPA